MANTPNGDEPIGTTIEDRRIAGPYGDAGLDVGKARTTVTIRLSAYRRLMDTLEREWHGKNAATVGLLLDAARGPQPAVIRLIGDNDEERVQQVRERIAAGRGEHP